MSGKIDVHHHTLPGFFCKAIAASHDVSGAPAPESTIEGSLKLMDKIDVTTSIISLSAPGAEIAGSIEGSRALARQYNDYGHEFSTKNPSRLGFFGALPSLSDGEGSIDAIKYALDEKNADGVTLFTSYGDKYLGHPDFVPIWAELDKRNAVVFIHPTHTPTGNWASPQLQQPIIDYPHETTRTACDLVISGRKAAFPHCKVILSHGGGTLPYQIERLEQLCSHLFQEESVAGAPTGRQITELAKTFYFDTALAGTANVLDTLLRWAPSDRLLFGSDFPYAPEGTIEYNTKSLAEYRMEEGLRRKIYRENAQELFPRLQT